MRRKPLTVTALASAVVLVLALAAVALNQMNDRPETNPDPHEYDYLVEDGIVKSYNGEEVHESNDFTHALIWAVGQPNKRTFVPAGHYDVEHGMRVADGITLYGEGQGNNGTVFDLLGYNNGAFLQLTGVSNVTFRNFQVEHGGIEVASSPEGSRNSIIGGHLFENITLHQTVSKFEAAFKVWVREDGGTGIVQNLTFKGCQVTDTECTGFFLGGGGANLGLGLRSLDMWVRDISFEDCQAVNCGIGSQRYNGYVCGFDLAEGANVRDISVIRCNATGNWMNGFHFEGSPAVENVTFIECGAVGNGVGSISDGSNAGWNIWREAPFNSQVILIDCFGEGNSGGDVFQGQSLPVLELPPEG